MTTSQAPAAAIELATEAADQPVVESIIDSSGVDQSVPGPSISWYFEELGSWFWQRMLGVLKTDPEVWASVFTIVQWSAIAIVVVIGVWLLARLVVFLLGARRSQTRTDAFGHAALQPGNARATLQDADAWWAAFDEARSDGRMPDALEALWWWAARSLTGEAADDSWTSRDLAVASNRPRIAPVLRRFDSMVYGPTDVSPDELSLLTSSLRRAIRVTGEDDPR